MSRNYMCVDGKPQLMSRLLLGLRLGRPLTSFELAHHIDENSENDTPNNLDVVTFKEHRKRHSNNMVGRRKNPPSSDQAWCITCKKFKLKDEFYSNINRWNLCAAECCRCIRNRRKGKYDERERRLDVVNDVHFKVDFSLAKRWTSIKCERSEKSRWLRRLTKLLVKAFELGKLDELSMMLGEVERRLDNATKS